MIFLLTINAKKPFGPKQVALRVFRHYAALFPFFFWSPRSIFIRNKALCEHPGPPSNFSSLYDFCWKKLLKKFLRFSVKTTLYKALRMTSLFFSGMWDWWEFSQYLREKPAVFFNTVRIFFKNYFVRSKYTPFTFMGVKSVLPQYYSIFGTMRPFYEKKCAYF